MQLVLVRCMPNPSDRNWANGMKGIMAASHDLSQTSDTLELQTWTKRTNAVAVSLGVH